MKKNVKNYMEVCVMGDNEIFYIFTHSLRDLKDCFPDRAIFRPMGPVKAPDAVLDVDGAYRRPAHVML